ncbi:MAG: ATP-binding protein [Nanoarchaeota archaeon]
MDEKELNFILQEGEGLKIEFKERFDSSLAEDMVAFANAEGGRIFLGVTDKGIIKNIEISNRLKSQIQDLARNCDPPIKITSEEVAGVLIILVAEGKDKPYKCKEGFFLRIGPNSQKLTRDEIVEFIVGEGKVLFEEQITPSFNLEKDFSKEKLEKYMQRAKLSSNLLYVNMLNNLGLLSQGKLNNAGILFFAKKPCVFIKQAYVNCIRFKGNGRTEIIDRAIFEGDVVENIDESIKFVQRNTSVRYEIKEIIRKEIPEYPLEAIRESIINAVMHRNYFEKGATVSIEIFDDRINISNPGGLPKGLSKEDFGKKCVRRNPLIADLLYRIQYVERAGTGVERIRKSLFNAGLPSPKIEFNNFFTITIYNQLTNNVPANVPINVPVNERQKWILKNVEEKGQIRFPAIVEQFSSVSIKTLKRDIQYLQKSGVLKFEGAPKTGVYKRKD